MRAKEVRFDEVTFADIPLGWQRPSDLIEGFLLVAAMEMEERRRISPAAPFDKSVHPLLADRFRYDPFAGLLAFGGLTDEKTSRPITDGGAGPAEAKRAMARGEYLSRLPLLQLVWMYIDVVREQVGGMDFMGVLQHLEGVTLGKEGTILFVTGLDRQMHRGDELTPTELSFIEGRPISMPDYLHRLMGPTSGPSPIAPSGSLRVNDIWNVCFRLIENSDASTFIQEFSDRADAVQDILDRGAALGRAGARNLWPGWSTDIPAPGVVTPGATLYAREAGAQASHSPGIGAASTTVNIETDWTSSVKAIAAGHSHSLTLRDDGTVAAFGSNEDGQCNVPHEAHGASSIACGGFHSLAVLSDGSVVGWGANLYRQSEPPVGLGEVIAVAGGHTHSLALLADGTVMQWGKEPDDRQVPVGLADVVAISAGYEHSIALTKPGSVVVWGSNAKGQLDIPADLSDVVAVSAGGWQCFALRRDGSVVAWGEAGGGATSVPDSLIYSMVDGGYWHAIAVAGSGPLAWGDDEYGQTRVPHFLSVGSLVASVAAGSEHSVALTTDGRVIGWGRGDCGQIGFARPTGFSEPSKPGDFGAALLSSKEQELQSVWGWGSTDDGLLGYAPELSTMRPSCIDGISEVSDVTIVGSTAYAFLRDGSVWGWGANTEGQLSDGSTLDRYRPIRIPALTEVVRIEPGPIAFKRDGTAWTWSTEHDGRLQPLLDPQIAGVRQVTHLGNSMTGAFQGSDAFHALRTDGTVVAWGRNDAGQLGNRGKGSAGEVVALPAPVMIPATRRSLFGKVTEVMQSLADVASLVRAGESVFAVTADGSVWAWGANRAGQLADGTQENRNTPVRLTFSQEVIGLWTHRMRTQGHPWMYALTRSGNVWRWRGGTGKDAVPEQIPELSAVVDLSVAEGCAAALTRDGIVMAWNTDTHLNRNPPVKVEGLDGAVAIVAGAYSAALRADGTVASWHGAGDRAPSGGWYPGRYTAILAEGLTGIRKLSTGNGTIVALRDDGTVWPWGSGSRGQLGNGNQPHKLIPEPIEIIGPSSKVLGGEDAVVAIREGGVLTAWGDSYRGNNMFALSADELRAGGPWGGALGLRGVTGISIGWGSALALTSDGTVWATGGGTGAEASETRPLQVRQLTNITAIASGRHTKYALDADGEVWAWGDAQRNQIGDGAILIPGPSMSGMVSSREVPVRSLVPNRVLALAACHDAAFALDEDGTVWAWGNNEHGELGNGQQQDMSTLRWDRGAHIPRPAPIRGLEDIKAIAAAGSTAYAVGVDGTLWGWGHNDQGQLGHHMNSEHVTAPVVISGLPRIAGISTSGDSTFATGDDGSVWAWGLNRDGQLGDGTQIDRHSPVQIPLLHSSTSITCVGKATFALKAL